LKIKFWFTAFYCSISCFLGLVLLVVFLLLGSILLLAIDSSSLCFSLSISRYTLLSLNVCEVDLKNEMKDRI